MLDQAETKAPPSADDSARIALHADAMNASSKAPEAHPASSKVETQAAAAKVETQAAQLPSEQKTPVLSANEQRKADEAKFFTDMYEKQNFELDPLKEGQGPYQCLEQMEKEGKISLSQDQLLAESRRIQERDFKDLGRSYYKTSDHVKLWSESEIQSMVQQDVNNVKGIDVSNWQHTIDWKQVKNAGYQFAFLKATEGVDYVDPTFSSYRQGAHDAGMKVGFYHYFHPENSVADQVKLFSDVIGKADPDSLRVVIDAEDPSMWQRYTVNQRVKMVDDFLQGVQQKTGITPEIYCSPNFAKDVLGNSPALAKYGLWIANYGVDSPSIPSPWSKYQFWQYTSSGHVPGIQGNVDLDMYNGTDLNQSPAQAKKQHV